MARVQKNMPSAWLVGTWKSDKNRTLAQWSKSGGSASEIPPHLRDIFGKLVVKYTAKLSFTEFEDQKTRSKYRVVWENDKSVFLVFGSHPNESGQLINFIEPNVYWVHAGQGIEYFSRKSNA